MLIIIAKKKKRNENFRPFPLSIYIAAFPPREIVILCSINISLISTKVNKIFIYFSEFVQIAHILFFIEKSVAVFALDYAAAFYFFLAEN